MNFRVAALNRNPMASSSRSKGGFRVTRISVGATARKVALWILSRWQ
jgi:hypothetical protein